MAGEKDRRVVTAVTTTTVIIQVDLAVTRERLFEVDSNLYQYPEISRVMKDHITVTKPELREDHSPITPRKKRRSCKSMCLKRTLTRSKEPICQLVEVTGEPTCHGEVKKRSQGKRLQDEEIGKAKDKGEATKGKYSLRSLSVE